MLNRTIWATVAVIAGLLPLAAGATDAAPLAAVWQKHEEIFTYTGITSYYSCGGIEGKLKLLLVTAGARDDLNVSSSCFDPPYGVSPFTSARLTFYTLAPATASPAAPAAEPPARPLGKPSPTLRLSPQDAAVGAWKSVRLRAGTPHDLEDGDCELVEQFEHALLKDFTIRGRTSHMTCTPHQVSRGGIDLSFEVLAPLPSTEQPRPRAVQ